MARPYLIAVIGKSAKDPGDPPSPEALRAAELVGANIAGAGAILITGGLSGVMEAASRGAKRANGLVIGMLPGFKKEEANRYVDVALTTGMGWMRNTLVVRAADAVIMISGGIGTLNELTIAYQDKPTVILEGTGGWSDRIREVAYRGKHLDESGSATLHFATTPEEAVDRAIALAADPAAYPKSAEKEFQS
ncbi:MAG TPA: TIGR00725 family protein [Candidatus Saccharimonadales bacterium]|nr:TIGR00725 family protein [Candidatus Saccharimonadales bacterium]